MQVTLTKHASDRLYHRCGVKTTPGTEVDISSAFRHIKTVYNSASGQIHEHWALRHGRVLLVIEQASQRVVTVITDGPQIDDLYAVDHKVH